MRAIGYFRESKRRTLAEQSEAFIAFCNENGYEAAATFLDSDRNAENPGFRQLLDFARQQGAQGFLMVVVPDLGTLGDGPTDAARRYFQLSSLNLPIISIQSGGDLASEFIDAWGKLRANGGLGDRVKAAMRKKAVKGEALGRPPYGYKVGPKRRLVVVPEEGSVVRFIFRLYLKDGLGIRRIARRLNEEDLRTRRGGLWSMVTVRDILRNRAYVGTYSRFGVRVPASHAPLISQEDFGKVQERLDQRRPSTAKRTVSPFLLSGLTFCGYCGNKMIGVTRKQKWKRGDGTEKTAQYRYYQCESRTNRSLCDYHTRRAETLEAEVAEALHTASLADSTNGAGSKPDVQAQMTRLRDKVRRLDKRIERYLDAAANGNTSADRAQAMAQTVAAEQLQLEDKLMEAQRLAEQHESEGEVRRHREQVVARLRTEWETLDFADKQDLLREVIDSITVTDEGVDLKFKS
ncbi:MAG TPA: recombinase family protein [Dehalococcoidia bacterium]|nr:recombinase family protein [Dehalococcoidia bacterium]